jgi:hypothetical protein
LTTVPAVGPIFGTVLKSTAFGGAAVASCGVPPTGCAIAGDGAHAAKDIMASAAAQLLEAGLRTPPRPIGVLNIMQLDSSLLVRFWTRRPRPQETRSWPIGNRARATVGLAVGEKQRVFG